MKIRTLSFIGLFFWLGISFLYLITSYTTNISKEKSIENYNQIINLKLEVEDLLILTSEFYHNENTKDSWLNKQEKISILLDKIIYKYDKEKEILNQIKKIKELNDKIKELFLDYLQSDKTNENLSIG